MKRRSSLQKSDASNVIQLFPRRARGHSVTAMNWDTALTHFTVYQEARGFRPRTISNRLATVRRLAKLCDRDLVDVGLDDLMRMQARGISNASKQTERSDLQAFFGYLVDAGVLEVDPSAKLPKVKVLRRQPRPFSLAQIEAMLSSGAYRRTRVMIMLGYFHGMRAHEIAKVHSRDFDLAAGTLRVLGKGGRERVLPIHPELAAEIPTMPDGYWFPSRGTNTAPHIHYRSVCDLMTRAKERAGIRDEKLTGHSLRHAYGTQLVWSGTDLRTAQELLGHASLATTQLYTAVREDHKHAAVIALPAPAIPIKSGRRRAAA